MQKKFGAGVAINYHPGQYSGCDGINVIETRGSKKEMNAQEAIQPLGQLLGNDFLDCKIGKVGLFYDLKTQDYATEDVPRWLMTTSVSSSQREIS